MGGHREREDVGDAGLASGRAQERGDLEGQPANRETEEHRQKGVGDTAGGQLDHQRGAERQDHDLDGLLEDGDHEEVGPPARPLLGLRQHPEQCGNWPEDDEHRQQGEAHQHLEDQEDRHDAVGDGGEDERQAFLRGCRLVVSGEADVADAGGEGVVDVDQHPRELERQVGGERCEDDAREELHRLVVGRPGVLLDDDVEATPHDDDRERDVDDGAGEVVEAADGRTVVGAFRRRARDEVERRAAHAQRPVDEPADRLEHRLSDEREHRVDDVLRPVHGVEAAGKPVQGIGDQVGRVGDREVDQRVRWRLTFRARLARWDLLRGWRRRTVEERDAGRRQLVQRVVGLLRGGGGCSNHQRAGQSQCKGGEDEDAHV